MRRPSAGVLAAWPLLLTTIVPADASHGAAGDPNLSLESVEVVGEARRGRCTEVSVEVKNTSFQVEVSSPWRVRLATLDAEGRTVSEAREDRYGLGHRWEERSGGPPDIATLVFERVELPVEGEARLRATVELLSDKQREYAADDNVREIAVRVAGECPAGSDPRGGGSP